MSGLTRKQPLRRTRLVRRTPLVAKKVFTGKVRRRTGPAREVVDLVYERAAHACELCLAPVGPVRGVDHHLHHRKPRRAGGSRADGINSAANLLLLDPSCHLVIEVQRAAAYDGGWLLHDRQDPVEVPVLIGAERWVRLTVDGRYVPVRARCPECRCDPVLCALDDTGEHCADRSCGTCLHGCPLERCEACAAVVEHPAGTP